MSMPFQRQLETEVMDVAAEADAYAAADFAQVNQAFVERLVELAGDRPGARALDLGTGPADIPIRLARRRPDWRIVAADASAPMLEHARNLVRQAGLTEVIELVLVDAKATTFAPNSFDVIFSNSILHHLEDATPLWSEVKRLAKPGATVLMRDLARPADAEAARRIVRQYAGTESSLLQEEYYRSLLAAYTPDEVRSQLRKAGLTSLQVSVVTDRHLDVFGRVGD
jgi:ubiquinone/menaquinone biosynthesis C-methylase UbiE